jgi:hypothetical protein
MPGEIHDQLIGTRIDYPLDCPFYGADVDRPRLVGKHLDRVHALAMRPRLHPPGPLSSIREHRKIAGVVDTD